MNKYTEQFNKIVSLYENAQFQDTIDAGNELFKSLGIKITSEGKESDEQMLAYHIKELQSYAYLSLGELQKGWDLWIYRSSARKLVPTMSRICTLPFWHGNKLGDKNLIIMAEEGLGDELFSSSVFHLLPSYANKIYIQCDKRLRSLYERTYPEFTFFDRGDWDKFKEYGRTCAAYGLLSDLPRYLDPLIERKEERYLRFNKDLSFPVNRPIELPFYGVSYFTYNENQEDFRNMPIEVWKKIKKSGSFFNLQETEETKDTKYLYNELVPFEIGDLFNDIEQLATIIARLDKVYSIDNTVAHLSARLGVSTDVYIPKFSNPRWKFDLLPKKWHPTVTVKKMHDE
jgi:hypothetical protein